MTIGDVAKRVGIRPSAVRYYENRGIIPRAVRSENGYRAYSNKSVKLLTLAVHARSLGITLKEIKSIVDLILANQSPWELVKQMAVSHLKELDAQIQRLEAARGEFHALLEREPITQKEPDTWTLLDRVGHTEKDSLSLCFP